ncbi:MarR family transcriptional regulator [Pandoraea terrae]|uniref:MarR family winged helix-turn-helix transcriptional regulator n=1 Tax=Pandoraea terrae TaxID=1537710 RepID=UPI0030845CC9
MARARNMVKTDIDAALKSLDITAPQMGILLSMSSNRATTPFELSKSLAIDTGLMTRMLDKLETRDLLRRERSVEDRRVVNLFLTDAGKEIADQIPGIVPGVFNRRLTSFSVDEFNELRRLLKKFTDA